MTKIYTIVDCADKNTIKLNSGELVELREYADDEVDDFIQQTIFSHEN